MGESDELSKIKISKKGTMVKGYEEVGEK